MTFEDYAELGDTLDDQWPASALMDDWAAERTQYFRDVNDLRQEVKQHEERTEKAEAENKELNALFNMQQRRMGEAIKLWQDATGKDNTLPDLGRLLDWLMNQRINLALDYGLELTENAKLQAEVERLQRKRWRLLKGMQYRRGIIRCMHIKTVEFMQRTHAAEAEVERLREALELTLPMAKGYAGTHPFGPNLRYVKDAQSLLEES